MQFNTDLFKQILNSIEYRLKFVVDGVNEAQSFDINCSIAVDDIIASVNTNGSKYKVEDIKYCLAVLRQMDYIDIAHGTIKTIKPSGYKFLLYMLHGIDCRY